MRTASMRENKLIEWCHAVLNSVEINHTGLHAHDDVIKWKRFPSYRPFVRGIHRASVDFSHKGQWHGALMFSLNKWFSKQSRRWWFEMPSHSLWHHCNVHNCCDISKMVKIEELLSLRACKHFKHSAWEFFLDDIGKIGKFQITAKYTIHIMCIFLHCTDT